MNQSTWPTAIQKAYDYHGRFQDAVKAWQRTKASTKHDKNKLVLFGLIQSEVDKAVKRHVEDQGKPTISWENALWLISPNQKPALEDLASKLGVKQNEKNGKYWYESFHVDSSTLQSNLAENFEKERGPQELYAEYRKYGGGSSYCDYVSYGRRITYARAQMEYAAKQLRNWVLYNGDDGSGELPDPTVGKKHPVAFQRAFASVDFATQVTVVHRITEDLTESRAGMELLEEMAVGDTGYCFDALAMFNFDLITSQTTYVIPEAEVENRPLVSLPSTGKGFDTHETVDDRWMLTGEGKTEDLLDIGSRLLAGLSQRVGDRGRETKTENPSEDILKIHLEAFNRAAATVVGATVTDAFLQSEAGWGENESEARETLTQLRKGKLEDLPDPSSSASDPPFEAAIESAKETYGLMATLNGAISELSQATGADELPLSRNLKAVKSSAGAFFGSLKGAFFMYSVAFGETNMSDDDVEVVGNQLNAAFGVYDSLTGFQEALGDAANDYIKARNGDLDDFVSMMDDLDDIENADDVLKAPALDFGKVAKAFTVISGVIDAGMSAYQSYRLWDSGDVDAAVAMGIAGGLSVAGLVVELVGGASAGPIGAAIALAAIVTSIVVAHLTDHPIENWVGNTVFGTTYDTRDADEFDDPGKSWFLYDDDRSGTFRQVVEYMNHKMGFEILGDEVRLTSSDSGAFTMNEIVMGGAQTSRLAIVPISTMPEVWDAKHVLYFPHPHPTDTSEVTADQSYGDTTVTLEPNEVAAGSAPSASFKDNTEVWSLNVVFSGGSERSWFAAGLYDQTWGIEVVHIPAGMGDDLSGFVKKALPDKGEKVREAAAGAALQRIPFPRTRAPLVDNR